MSKEPLGTDLHSYSNFLDISPSSLSLSLRVDFGRKILYGYVDYPLVAHKDNVTHVSFDTNSLAIESVTLLSDSKSSVEWTMPKTHKALGRELRVTFSQPLKKDESATIRIKYSTTPDGGALQWFEPQQTAGGKHPYVYTQCQAILARTLLPCMDSPSVKVTCSFHISVPSPLIAVAGGLPVEGNPKFEDDGYLTYSYQQPIPIPSYLVAIAAGKLKQKKIGKRSTIWTEEELLEASVHEFSEHTETFIETAENLFDDLKYDWGIYGLLVLPPAFPYGGMENPNLTFLSSSLLAGDRSLVDVVAHEICHSWSGNLATNSTWTDFWLNEGFTMYLERLLLGSVIGGDDYRLFHIYLGYKELIKVVKDLTDAGDEEWTKLEPNLLGVDPDDAFSIVPYEKGCLLLFYLELKVGGKENMQKWLNSLYTTYARKSYNCKQMREHFLDYFKDKVKKEELESIDWNSWLTKPGNPPFDPSSHFENNPFSIQCQSVIDKWIVTKDGSDFATSDLSNFKPSQVMFCLDELVSSKAMPLSAAKIEKMDDVYKFSTSTNVEISNRFLVICLKSKYRPVLPAVDHFLSKHGRGRYVKPLYHFLNEMDHSEAVSLWKKHRSKYHSVIHKAFDPVLSS